MMEDLIKFFKTLWQDAIDWMKELRDDTILEIKDLSLDLFELFVSGGVVAISAIVPPEILATSLDTISSGMHPSVHYFLQQSGLAQGISLIGSGVMFRIARKVYSFGLL
jgi:hypothetical protein